VILRKLTKSDKSQAIAGHNELAKENWEYLLKYEPEMNWEQYLELLDNESKGINLASDRVQATFLIAEVNETLVGRTSIRHSLNDFLFNAGGHIGYGVRPEFREKGYAKEILRQSLKFIQDAGVTRALLTCSENNIASAKVIESQGGVLENLVEHEGTLIRRYWIDLSKEKETQKLA
jgi:predicted acetyltransferase